MDEAVQNVILIDFLLAALGEFPLCLIFIRVRFGFPKTINLILIGPRLLIES